MADAKQPNDPLPIPIYNMVPVALHQACLDDYTVHAVFQRACVRNDTREQALIDVVQALLQDKARLLRALNDAESRRPNVIHLDGDRTMLVQKEPTDG